MEDFDLQKLGIRDMLVLLNERYKVLSGDISENNSKMDSYIKQQTEMRIEMERMKTAMKIYIAIAVFLAAAIASAATALIVK